MDEWTNEDIDGQLANKMDTREYSPICALTVIEKG